MVDFDIIAVVQQSAVLPVAVVCYLAGAVLKRLEVFADKYIPLALLPVGLIGALWINAWSITPETVFAGIASAALAVYAHQTGKQLSKKNTTDATDKEG